MSGYPIFLGGDHAAFEIEHADMPPEQRPDWPLPSFDAQDWAKAFCKIASELGYRDSEGKPVDEGWMVTWFANALMRGYDQCTAEQPPRSWFWHGRFEGAAGGWAPPDCLRDRILYGAGQLLGRAGRLACG